MKPILTMLCMISQFPGFVLGFLAGCVALGVIAGYTYATDVVVRIADWCES